MPDALVIGAVALLAPLRSVSAPLDRSVMFCCRESTQKDMPTNA